MFRSTHRFVSIVLIICIATTYSGCTTLRSSEMEEYGYHGESVVKEGAQIAPLDWIGNILGAIRKLLLWNWRVERHRITDGTKEAIDLYLADHADELGDLHVQLNRYAPGEAFQRLFDNKGVAWPYRYTVGILIVLLADTLLVGRVFGGDRYNTFTHTVDLHSDVPSIALHELGHARDVANRRWRGTYAMLRLLPFFNLYHESQATDDAIEYTQRKPLPQIEVDSYRILYPAYGIYVGGYNFGGIGYLPTVLIGHFWGRHEAQIRKRQLGDRDIKVY